MITRSVYLDVELSPYELAQEFCNMDAEQQAMFLNHVASISEDWDGTFVEQVQAIVNSNGFLNGANKVMKIFGEYAK
jgi:hypothetical protein